MRRFMKSPSSHTKAMTRTMSKMNPRMAPAEPMSIPKKVAKADARSSNAVNLYAPSSLNVPNRVHTMTASVGLTAAAATMAGGGIPMFSLLVRTRGKVKVNGRHKFPASDRSWL